MKRLLMASIAVFLFYLQADAQKFLNIYQDGLIIKKISTSFVDSISVTEQKPYTINIWYKGNVYESFASEEVDSMKVIDEKAGPLSYLATVGFNSEIYSKKMSLLSSSTISQHESFISNLPKKDGTILYYAVDSALNILENANIKSQLSSINFITFTDGLDQGSIMMNPQYTSSISYLEGISKRIKETQYNGLDVNSFSIGLRGTDVTDVDMFKRNLTSLASSEQNAFELRYMSELDSRLQEIANKIININTRQTVSVKIPGVDDGTRVRFTFDGYDAVNSQLFIEGTLRLSDYALHDVTYHGIKARSGSVVQGTQDGIFLTFTFRGMRKEDGEGVLPTNNIYHYYLLPSKTDWQKNSEFKPTNNTQRIVSYSGTAIVLVLDCSSSLGYDFSNMKNYANKFIRLVAQNAMPFTLEIPTNVKAAMDDNYFAVNVSWDAVKGADFYQVYRNMSNSNNSTYELVADSVSTTSWKDKFPRSDKNSYKVRAVGLGLTSNQSGSSNMVSCTINAPTNLEGELEKNGNSLCICINWDSVKYAESYKVYRSPNTTSSNFKLIADNINTCSWKDISPLSGSNYYKIVAVCCGVTGSESSICEVKYVLDFPKNVKAEHDETKIAVHLSWDEVMFAQIYKVYRSKNSSSNFELVADSIKTTSWTDNTPFNGNNYYRISAEGYDLTSEKSNSSSVNCSLGVPKNVRAALDDTDYAITVTWDTVKYAESYKVYRSPNTTSSNFKLIADNINTCTWKDTLPLGSQNYYKVSAVSQTFDGTASSYVSVYSSLSAPKNIVGELAPNGDKLAINVKWDAVKYAECYRVYRSKYSGSNFSMVADSIRSTSFMDISPLSGSNYYKVCALGHGMTSSNSQVSSAITNSMSAPTNVSAELVLDGNNLAVNITWDAVKMAEKYQVYRSYSSGGSFSLIADNITTNSWIDKSPLVGSNYYRIVAVGYGATSIQSNSSKVVNCSLDAPANVTGELMLNNGNALVIKVTWGAVKFAESYNVYRCGSQSGTYSLLAENVKLESWIDESPLVGSNYYKIYAVGHGLTSQASKSSVGVNCSLSSPTNVAGELVLNGRNLIIKVTWDGVKYAESYNVYRCGSQSGTYSLLAENVKLESWIDESPIVGSNYYKVYAVGHGLTSGASYASSVVNCTLSAPTNVSGKLLVNGSKLVVNISWNTVTFAETYNVYRSSSISGSYTKIAEKVTSSSWQDDSPLNGSNYYKIYAEGYGLTSKASNASNAVNYSISAPTNVVGELVVNGNKFAADVKWDDVSFAQSYIVYRSKSYSGSYTKIAENITTTSWKDVSPLDGYNYYKIYAVGYGMTSQASKASNVVNCSISAPTNVKGVLVLSNNKLVASLSWDDVAFAESYIVYRSSAQSGTYTKIADGITSTSWKDENPMDGNNYYKVQAIGYGYTSSQSKASNVVQK